MNIDLVQLAGYAAQNHLLPYALLMQPNYETPPHLRLLARKLEAVERGEITRLIVTLPPRHGKSNLISELFPAWYLGKRPNEQVLFATYGQDLADGFGRKVRNHIASPQHQTLFLASRLADDSKSANKFSMSAGGVYNALGVGGPGTGKGADCLIVDDALKNREEADSKTIRDKVWDWYAAVAYTRLMPGARIVIVHTRWQEDDLIGRLLKGHEQFELLNLPAVAEENDALGRKPGEALWPERYNKDDLQRIRYTIGEREFAALYQQRPAPLEGALFRRQWIQRATAPRAGARIAMGVDLALSTKQGADYTAIVVVARDEFGKIYVLDAVRQRADFPTALGMIREMAAKWKPMQIGIESVAYQAVVVQELLRTTTLPIRGITPDRDKMTRATPVALRYEQGMIYHADLPSWFEDELLAFPQGEHDDAVDALVYAYLTAMKLGFSDDVRVRPPDVSQFEPMDEEIGL